MKTKFIAFSMLLIALSSIACRQDEVLQENEEIITSSMSDATLVARDSIPTTGISDPPPKDKDHWKTASKDTVKTPPKVVIGISALDSNFDIAITPIDENGPKDPPKDKDHWRVK